MFKVICTQTPTILETLHGPSVKIQCRNDPSADWLIVPVKLLLRSWKVYVTNHLLNSGVIDPNKRGKFAFWDPLRIPYIWDQEALPHDWKES
jgi:hypothetical protein